MSLKAFHVFFLVVSIIFSGGFTYYAVQQSTTGNNEFMVFGVISALICTALLGYTGWFLIKMRNVGFL